MQLKIEQLCQLQSAAAIGYLAIASLAPDESSKLVEVLVLVQLLLLCVRILVSCLLDLIWLLFGTYFLQYSVMPNYQ